MHQLCRTAVIIALCAASPTRGGAQPDPPAANDPGVRVWTYFDGRTVRAGIKSATDTSVTLRLPNGKFGTVELGKLTEADRQHVATWLENNAAPEGFGAPEQTIGIVTLKGQMRYDKKTFSVYPGKKVKLVLRNDDDMHHNLIITKPGRGKGMKVAMEAWKLGADGFAKHWLPDHPDILFASKMADPHSSATLYFTAPEKTGKYPYVCTLPGHAQVMNGTMVVTRNVNPLSELTFTVYKGSWNKLPEFEALKPTATDHVESGKFDLACTKERENFGVVFNGVLEVAKDGDHLFTLASDDGSRLLIDGRVVIDNDGVHGHASKSGKARLSKGEHDIEVQYFERSGEETLYVGWRQPGEKKEQPLSKGGNRGGGGSGPSGQLLVAEDEARIYRNFIQGGGPRAIGVGYPGGLNLAFDANNMRIAMVWLGDFIDAARHWNGRGQGFQPPAGESVAQGSAPGVPFAVLTGSATAWPDTFARKDNAQLPPADGGYRFDGYRLGGEQRIPSFRYRFGGLAIEDTPGPRGNSESADVAFVRTLRLSGQPVDHLYFRAAVSGSIEPADGGSFIIGEDLIMSFKTAAKPIVRETGGAKELLVPVEFSGNAATIEQTIGWQ